MPKKPSRKTAPPDSGAPALHASLVVVEVDDPLLLVELRADPKIGPLLVCQLSDRHAVARFESGDTLIQQLLKAGHLPRVVEP
jgi:hypothetical protein